MLNEIKSYIDEAVKAGHSQEQIKKSLLEAGWGEKVINDALGESLFPAHGTMATMKSKIFLVGILGLVLIGGAVLGWQLFVRDLKPENPAKFSLEAKIQDSAGVDPKTSFILKSDQAVSENAVKKIIKFNPPLDFDVKKTKLASSIISSVLAQDHSSVASDYVFEIIPSQSLSENNIYQVSIADLDYADREYSWAFQVKAPFQITQTFPRNKATHVPVNSGIEVTFNRENLINPQDYFEINPDIEGVFEQHGATLIFAPKKPLAEKSVYIVTIKNGIHSQGSDERLVADHSFAFETGETAYSGQKPYFNFYQDFVEFVPNKNPSLGVYYYNVDPGSLEVSIFKFSDAEKFMESYKNSRRWDFSWTSYYINEQLASMDSSAGAEKISSFKSAIIEKEYDKFLEFPHYLENGYYLVDVMHSGGKHSKAWLSISPLAHYYSITKEKSILWLNDFQDKSAVSNANISFIDNNSISQFLGTTNSDGLLEFSTPTSFQGSSAFGPSFLKVENSSSLPVIIKLGSYSLYGPGVSEGDEYWDYLSTNRFTYQMSDTLRYWGVVKGRDQDLRQKKITVGLYSGYMYFGGGAVVSADSKPFATQEILVSQFDTIQGDLSFRGITPGYYNVVASFDGKVVSQAPVEILSYTKPSYQITVLPSRDKIYADEKVDFNVKAEFFDGTPVSNLKLRYSGYWKDSIEGKLTLDQNGEGKISYTPFYYESQYNYWPNNLNLYFSPEMAEEGEIYASANVLVFGPNVYLQSFSKKLSGDNYELTAKLNNIVIDNQSQSGDILRSEYIGSAAADYSLSANVVKITYQEIETGQYYDPIDKTVKKNYRYDRREQIIEQLSGKTNANGEWKFEKILPLEKGASYQVVFSGRDSKNRKISSITWGSYYSFTQWQDFSIALGIGGNVAQKEFSVGEKIKLEMQIQGQVPANPKVLFYRYQNNIDKAIISSEFIFEEVFDSKFSPSIQYRAVILGPNGFEETNPVVASFRELDNKLDIELSPNKEKYRPGDEASININIKDKNGKPISAEINVSVVDEALFHILPYNWQSEILSTLYRNIYVSPISGASRYALKESAGAEGGGCFGAGTPVLMKDGDTRPIEDIKIGDEILTLKNENSGELVPAIVQGISQHFVDEYLTINNSLKVTAEHKIFINGKWGFAGNAKVGDMLIDVDGTQQKIFSIKYKKAQDTMVYNIVVDKYHTYFAGGYFVHNAEKGGSPRANFVDVALYQTVHSDHIGNASVSFKIPDNITAWRTTAIAFSPSDMKAGQTVKLLKSGLPFFVDATSASTYLTGDEPIIRTRIFGDKFIQNENVEFFIKSSSLNLDKKEKSTNNFTYLSLGKLTEGDHEIIISAKQGQNEDSLIKRMKTITSYFRKLESSKYSLTENISQLEGDKNGLTNLLFADAGKGRFYNALAIHTYFDGIRADQLVGSFWAQKLLAKYFKAENPADELDLAGYHTQDGGIAIFPYADNDLELTAKIADLSSEYIFKNDVISYFNSSLKDKKFDVHRISKALYGLASLGEPVLVKVNNVKNSKDVNLEDRIYLGLALAKLGDRENARMIYESDIIKQFRFQGEEAWLDMEKDITKRVKISGMAGVLASYIGKSDDANVFWNYIESHNPERDLDILEETLLIKSELEKSSSQEAKFTYQTSSKKESVSLQEGVYSMVLPHEDLQSIKFSNIEGNIFLISSYEREADPTELVKNSELSISRKYLVNNNQTTVFNDGDIVKVRLDPNISAGALDGTYQVVDYLPSGLKPIMRTYERGFVGESTECDPIWYPAKITDNAIYFDIDKGFDKTSKCSNRTINYYARVVSKGKYRANPAVIQSLKDLNSLNISSENIIEVK